MKELVVGQKAPDFESTDVMGKRYALSDYKDGYVLIAFLRYAGCPWCNLSVHRLVLESKLLSQNNCQVITFIQSKKEDIVTNIHDRHAMKPVFPVIADPEKLIYRKYGVGSRPIKATGMAIKNIPAWVHAVRDEGFKQGKVDGDLFLAPAIFLVNARSKEIVKAMYGKNLFEHETFTPIYESLLFHD